MMHSCFRYLGVVVCFGLLTGCATFQQSKENQPGLVSAQENIDTSIQDLFKTARNHQQKNELINALNVYEKIIELAPHYYEAYNNMGMIYFMMGEDEMGIQFFNEAIRLAPTVSSLRNNLGYALLKQGRSNEAAEVLERAIQLDPANLHARNNLRAAYRQIECSEGDSCGKQQDK